MSYKVVTTIGPNSWERYGRRFVESFKKYWPAHVELEIFHHHLGDNVPTYEGVNFRALDMLPDFVRISNQLGPAAQDGPSLSYAFKAIALAYAVTPDTKWIGFVDADTETMRPVDDNLLNHLFNNDYDLTYLYRKSVQESEGSWFAFNATAPNGASLLNDYFGIYASMEFTHFRKSHDNAVLDRLVNIHAAHGLRVCNLADGALGLDAFHQSPLGAYMVHTKGPNKDTIADPGLAAPQRYQTLCEILQHSVVETGRADICEVGAWNGSRAVQMAESLFNKGYKRVSYIGFDTFDEGNDRQHEGHTKPHATYENVRRRLENYAKFRARTGYIFEFMLVKGNTMETLPRSTHLLEDVSFAYIDGGHSFETTDSDYNCLKHVPYVVFDDVIKEPEAGAPEGPIKVWKAAEGQRFMYTSGDRYAGLSQTISFGIVARSGFKLPELKQSITVQPVDSVPKTEQFEHISENTREISEWLSTYQAHERVALLVSAGPSLPDYLEYIRENQRNGNVVFAVKHAVPVLLEAGIRPDFTVILDPRPVDGVSTHGIERTELLQDLVLGDKVLFATMTHPSTRKYLERQGAKLIGWHAHTNGTADAKLEAFQTGMVVGGGTCSATRMPMLAFIMGFRRLEFIGYDLCYKADTDATKLKQSLMRIKLGDLEKEFVTTGELVAAMQDLGTWCKWMVESRLSIIFHGDGAGIHIWQQTVKDYVPPEEFPW